jgi:hypothetical protein
MLHRVSAALSAGVLLCTSAALCASDLPPSGRSLFDHLTTRTIEGRSVQRIPYPFPALLQEIRRHAGTDALGREGMAAVLIPLGRSLQRNASAGDYFQHPRVVVAVTGEARTGVVPRLLLKDRLFLGFQDEAGVIEVISYNEHAGRFEFQVVTDYRPGATPRVAYARRAVCSACHHAAAPIFSRPGWDETNANPAVAQALSAHAPTFHGVAVKRGVDVPNAIDDAVARANRIAIAQTLWQRGCDAVRAPADAVGCRQRLLTAVLERRLGRTVDAGAATEVALDALAAAWTALWPQGIAEPDPNIPNRDPFFGQAQQFAVAKATAPWGAEEIVPALDPMSSRAPIAAWRADARGMDALLYTLGTFLARADVQAIEHALARKAKHSLAEAVAATAADSRAGRSDALASAPFRRAVVLRALSSHLDLRIALDCCDQAQPAFALAVAEGARSEAPVTIPETLRPFYTHCAACHDMPTASPPGFLHGSIAAVERNLQRCAARIRFRLAMWRSPASGRVKVPMPPPIFVPAWEHAPPRSDIERMLDFASRAMGAAAGNGNERGYEALPQCREPGPEERDMRAR